MFLRDLSASWERHGADAIEECRRTDVATYVRLAASLIPKEFGVRVSTNPLADWTDEQLAAAYAALESQFPDEDDSRLLIADQNCVPPPGTVS